jgi:rRNA-processing protein FCF1
VLIAVDTNVLLDQATDAADVLDALDVIRRRLPSAQFVVPPTVLEELAWQYENGGDTSAAAETALRRLMAWGYRALNVVPVGKGIAEQIALKLRIEGVLPDQEQNDASIIAEAALLGCSILLSSDSHLLEAQRHPRFKAILRESDVEDRLVIASPRTIASRFFR